MFLKSLDTWLSKTQQIVNFTHWNEHMRDSVVKVYKVKFVERGELLKYNILFQILYFIFLFMGIYLQVTNCWSVSDATWRHIILSWTSAHCAAAQILSQPTFFFGSIQCYLTSCWLFPSVLSIATVHEAEPTRDIRCEFCGEYFENRKGLSSHARSHLRQMGITEWSVNGSPIDTLREVMHKRGVSASSQSDQGVKKESSQGANSPSWENTGRTGSSEGLGASSFQSSKFRKSPLSLLQSGSRLHKQGLGSVGTSATPSPGKFFRISPLGKRPQSEEAQSVETGQSPSHQLKTFSPQPHDFSFKRKPSPDKHGHQGESFWVFSIAWIIVLLIGYWYILLLFEHFPDPSCELCGFFFENRKALASHARAHLRQFGVTEWSVNGSPIETLSAWMRSRPQKVLEMHRSYMQGNRSTLKKVSRFERYKSIRVE